MIQIPPLGKWQIALEHHQRNHSGGMGWRSVVFACRKFYKLPKNLEEPKRNIHYKGILIRLDYWLPFRIQWW